MQMTQTHSDRDRAGGPLRARILAVTNPNLPDRDRATKQPTAAEIVRLDSRSARGGRSAAMTTIPSWAFSTMAYEVTSGFADFGQLELSAEPRSAWNNSPVNARRNVTETPWYGLYRTISSVNDALIAIDGGLIIVDTVRTTRTQAVGKFIQGISHGYLGALLRQGIRRGREAAARHDYQSQRSGRIPKSPLRRMKQTRQRRSRPRSRTNFTLPVDSWLYPRMTRDQFVQLGKLLRRAAYRVLGADERRARCGELGRSDPTRRCRDQG